MAKSIKISAILIIALSVSAGGTIIHVPDDYPTIQEGIDASGIGDTILVAGGTYYENLVVDHNLSLIGEDVDITFIDGSGEGDVVFIQANGVRVSEFTIRNGGNGPTDSGIKIGISDSCVIEYCNLQENSAGLDLYASSYNTISCCTFNLNYNGILFRESYDQPYEHNLGNQILNNILRDNTNCGILFEHMGFPHHHSGVVRGNCILDNGIGMSMIMSQQNDIYLNDIAGNDSYGITLGMCMGGGEYNTFHHNNFTSNNGGAIQALDTGFGTDYWYSQADEEGNYWSDYTGEDANGDGIGDDPYNILGEDNSQDLYPLMEPLYATIEGVVTDQSNDPIENVYVAAIGTSIYDSTNPDGGYTLESLGAGNYDISFSHPEYQDIIVNSVASTLNQVTILDIVMSQPGSCVYTVGDANGSGDFNGLDVTYSVSFFKGGPAPPYQCECTLGNVWYVAGDVNESCTFNGLDVTYMVSHFKGGPDPLPCPDCPPAG